MKIKLLFLISVLLLLISGCKTTNPADTGTSAPQTGYSGPAGTTAAEQTAATLATSYDGKLTEDAVKTLFAQRRPNAEFLRLARGNNVDYVFYKTGETGGHPNIKIDCCHSVTGECLQENILGDFGDIRIYGYDSTAVASEKFPVYLTHLSDLSEQNKSLPFYPDIVWLGWKNGKVEIDPEDTQPFFLPLTMEGYYWGQDSAKTVLRGYRVGYKSVSFGFLAAPGSSPGEGGQTMPLTRADYSAETNSFILTLTNTTLSSDLEKIGGSNDFIASVQAVAKGNDTEVTIALKKNVGGYSKVFSVYANPDSAEFTGVLEISFQFGAGQIFLFD